MTRITNFLLITCLFAEATDRSEVIALLACLRWKFCDQIPLVEVINLSIDLSMYRNSDAEKGRYRDEEKGGGGNSSIG